MSNKKDNVDQTKTNLNSTVDHEEITSLEASSHINERIEYAYQDHHSDDKCPIDPENIEAITRYASNIYSKISAEVFIISQNDSRSYPHHGIRYGNDETNGSSASNIDTPICVNAQTSNDRHLSETIFELFPGRDEQEVANDLEKAQNKDANIWQKQCESDKYKKRDKTKQIVSQMQADLPEEFDPCLSKTCDSQSKTAGKASLILIRPSYGGLFLNTKNEVLGVQNYNGTWSAPKGHQEMNDNGELETPYETFLRELFEEVSIKLKRRKIRKKLTMKNIGHFLTLDKIKYLEYKVDSVRGSNDQMRLIGLFVIHVHEKRLRFELPNKNENKDCKWLNMNAILKNKFRISYDKYYTLRPFVKHVNDHPELLANK